MDVRLSTEQKALRESAVTLVDRLRPQAVMELDDRERTMKLEAAVAASGWRELRSADDDGNPWSSGVEAAVVAEELGRGVADAAYLGPALAADLRRLAGAPAATGTETVAFLADLSVPAQVDGGSLTANAVAVDAAGAVTALVLVPAAGGFTLAEVALAAGEGSTGIDFTRPTVLISAGTVAVPVESTGSISTAELVRWTALGLALACADLVGIMRGATKLASDYAEARHQYGKAVGSFQAIQHLLADAFVLMEGSRSVALHAAWAVDALSPAEALESASIAKAYCARSAQTVCETSIQVHGGIGNTWECLAHIYLRRALVSADLLGGVGPSLDRVLASQQIGAGA
jgi:alkylation response protein AidB-like acyl-CoA dehydrogenase